MSTLSFDDIRSLLTESFAAQEKTVAEWHRQDPSFGAEPAGAGDDAVDAAGFLDLLARQHWCNFRLWHVEDRARRKDAGPQLIADCKYAIDKLNQERNDMIERLDMFLVCAMTPNLPPERPGGRPRHNTETIGAALDRGSILALKIFHMNEQAERTGVTPEFVEECRRKLAVLTEQRADLAVSVDDLLAEYAEGAKRPKVYYQFKMYNDPRLNPELYSRKAGL